MTYSGRANEVNRFFYSVFKSRVNDVGDYTLEVMEAYSDAVSKGEIVISEKGNFSLLLDPGVETSGGQMTI